MNIDFPHSSKLVSEDSPDISLKDLLENAAMPLQEFSELMVLCGYDQAMANQMGFLFEMGLVLKRLEGAMHEAVFGTIDEIHLRGTQEIRKRITVVLDQDEVDPFKRLRAAQNRMNETLRRSSFTSHVDELGLPKVDCE